MPKAVTLTSFTYEELSADAKTVARDWYRNLESQWYGQHPDDLNYDDWESIAAILGIEFKDHVYRNMGGKQASHPAIWWSLYPTRATWEGRYAYAKGCARAIRRYAPQDKVLHSIADRLTTAQKRNAYKVRAEMSGDCGHSECEVLHCDGTGYERPIIDVSEIERALEDFGTWIGKQIEADYEHRISDEAVADSIEANEYNFHENGQRFALAD